MSTLEMRRRPLSEWHALRPAHHEFDERHTVQSTPFVVHSGNSARATTPSHQYPHRVDYLRLPPRPPRVLPALAA